MTVSAEEFVKVWEISESRKEVAEKLNITVKQASQRASEYRRKGVNLKRYKQGRKGGVITKIELLNKLIEDLKDPS